MIGVIPLRDNGGETPRFEFHLFWFFSYLYATKLNLIFSDNLLVYIILDFLGFVITVYVSTRFSFYLSFFYVAREINDTKI